ncbi:hypothetical protein KKF84_21705, partial [Myxococcota bacterium]|nr:hypothetical protein [Myxococcota bacterium]
CSSNGDCTITNGTCLALEGTGNSVCTTPCDSTPNQCPDEYLCTETDTDGNQCIPRTNSCTEPSGGKETCRACNEWSDCIRGGCLPPDGSFDSPTYCLDYCDSTADCGPYATCESLYLPDYDVTIPVCLPNTEVDTCTHWRYCDEDCADPSQPCSFTYCIDNDSI